MQFLEDKESEKTKSFARVLFDSALLESGFQLDKPKDFNTRIYEVLADAYGIDKDLSVPVEPEIDEVEVCGPLGSACDGACKDPLFGRSLGTPRSA